MCMLAARLEVVLTDVIAMLLTEFVWGTNPVMHV